MKNLFCSLALMLIVSITVMAQQPTPIPADKNVRIGKLPNGLTYYIRHNARHEKKADFWLYTDIGAIQEQDSQIGFAHFLEHMAFNGTKNFPGNDLIDYCEKIGVRFGPDLNAGTGRDNTKYNISNVSVVREGVVDSMLLILHDWSHFISFDSGEIDKERGVVIEELRVSNNPEFRLDAQTDKALFNNTRYAYRNLLGTEEQLRTFKHEDLRDFYTRWHRPDLQAIIIVGDIDVDKMEAKLKKIMSDIPRAGSPEPKVPVIIPGNVEPIVCIATDPEQTKTNVSLTIKHTSLPREMNNTTGFVKKTYQYTLITEMLTNRLNEIAEKPNAPFFSPRVLRAEYLYNFDMMQFSVEARSGEAAKAFEALYAEIERAKRFGFDPAEFARVKSNWTHNLQKWSDGGKDKSNEDYVWRYMDSFQRNKPMPDDAQGFKIYSAILASITVETINKFVSSVAITNNNQVAIVRAPGEEGVAVASQDDLKAIIKKVRAQQLTKYKYVAVKESLITELLTGSKVEKTQTDKFSSTVWTLGNGMKIVVKPTAFKTDEVVVTLESYGGLSNICDEDLPAAVMLLNNFVSASGVGNLTASDLKQQLTGKSVSYTIYNYVYNSRFNGKCSPGDIETLMQLSYLYFTSPRFNREDFEVLKERRLARIKNLEKSSSGQFMTKQQNTLYSNDPRRKAMGDSERIEKATFESMERIYRQLYSNPGSFTVVINGNVDMKTLQPLVEKYFGSLSVTGDKLTWKDDNWNYPKGEVTNRSKVAMKNPMSFISLLYSGSQEYNLENIVLYSALQQILVLRYKESVREDKGAAYGVSVDVWLHNIPRQIYEISITLNTDPKVTDEIVALVKDEIKKIAENGPLTTDIAKVKESLSKKHKEELENNKAWNKILCMYHVENMDTYTDYDSYLEGVSAAKIKAIAARILANGNLVTVIMEPEPIAK